MTAFDYAVFLIVGLSVALALARGFIREVLALLAWGAAFWAAKAASVPVAAMLPHAVRNETLRYFAACALLFVGVLLGFSLLAAALSGLARGIGLGGLDRVLGALFGALRGLAIVLVLMLGAGFTSLPAQPFWRDAEMSAPLTAAAAVLRGWLPPDVARRIRYD